MAALGLVLAAVGAPAAVACNEPAITVNATSLHPGDVISFSITHLEPGATWSVVIDDQIVVASGDATASWPRTFTVPDLGDAARGVNVASKATHSDIPSGQHEDGPHTFQYSKPSAAPATPAATSTPAASAQPAPGKPAAHAKDATGKPAAEAKPVTKPTSAVPKPAREPATQRAGHRGHRDTVSRPREVQKPAQAVAPAVTAAPHAAPAHVAATPRAHHKRSFRAVPVGTAARLRRLAADLPSTPAPAAADATGAPAASERATSIPIAVGLAAAALLALLLALLVRRRRDGTALRRPAPDDVPQPPAHRALPLTEEERCMLAIEAELQEIVAEASRTVARSP